MSVLREIRLRRQRTLSSVAAAIGTTRSTLSKWELNEIEPPMWKVRILLDELEASDEERLAALNSAQKRTAA